MWLTVPESPSLWGGEGRNSKQLLMPVVKNRDRVNLCMPRTRLPSQAPNPGDGAAPSGLHLPTSCHLIHRHTTLSWFKARPGDTESQSSLGYRVKPCLK